MFLKKAFKLKRTIAFRLTLWYAFIFTLSTFLAFIFFYYLITSFILHRIDEDLVESMNSFYKVVEQRGLKGVMSEAIRETKGAGENKVFFRILNQRGDIFDSSNMDSWKNIKVNEEAIKLLLKNKNPILETIKLSDRRHEVRVFYAFLNSSNIMQLGRSMENHNRIIEAFRDFFFLTMFGIFIFAVLAGWFMARRVLSGVGKVNQIAKEISEGSLDKRVPLQHTGDEIDQMAETFNDMLDRIEVMVKSTRDMSDNIAHDLKSPITRIRGTAEIALTTGISEADFKDMAAGSIEECDLLLDMINSMLIISKTESGVGSIASEKINLSSIVKTGWDLFEPIAEEKKIEMAIQVVEKVIISGDERMIQRMVANLLDNAIKYTPDSGKITVSLESSGEYARLRFQDSGHGISEECLPLIFKRFYRCDPSRTQSGSGLGLSLARAVARGHGGDIQVTSIKGEGSVFTIELPMFNSHP